MGRLRGLAALGLAGCGWFGDPEPVSLGGLDSADRAEIVHGFGDLVFAPLEDDDTRCASWSLNNDAPLYVNAVSLANEGSFHHSNWFIVPEDVFPGPDGYWTCADRAYHELLAAANGTVLTAQSTQSFVEEQRFGEGAVIKIPPRWKVVGGLHTLNTAPRTVTSGLWMTLELVHPLEVEVVVSPISMQYQDLLIPPLERSRFTTECLWGAAYEEGFGAPLDLAIHYVLPHYHQLGDHFEMQIVGGDRDGEVIYSLDGFNGQANGRTFDPPLEVKGADGLRMTCGFDNPGETPVEWGNGDGEMCVALVMGEAELMLGGTVALGTDDLGVADGLHRFEGPCFAVMAPKNDEMGLPTEAEKGAPLYLPPASAGDGGPDTPDCRDTPASAVAEAPATLGTIQASILTPSCTFSACHGQQAAGRLDLASPGLHQRLLDHPITADTDLPLVAPGDADGSWLFQVLSRCEPTDREGQIVAHMPANSPLLLDDGLVATVRDWIDAGALDD